MTYSPPDLHLKNKIKKNELKNDEVHKNQRKISKKNTP